MKTNIIRSGLLLAMLGGFAGCGLVATSPLAARLTPGPVVGIGPVEPGVGPTTVKRFLGEPRQVYVMAGPAVESLIWEYPWPVRSPGARRAAAMYDAEIEPRLAGAEELQMRLLVEFQHNRVVAMECALAD